jgi:hypothetical protein
MGEEVVKAGGGKEREVWRGELKGARAAKTREEAEEEPASQPGSLAVFAWGLVYFWKRWGSLSFLGRHGFFLGGFGLSVHTRGRDVSVSQKLFSGSITR